MKPVKEGSKLRRNLSKRWYNLQSRCSDPNHPRYPQYGGNGVKICELWNDKELFIETVKSIPGFDEEKILNGKLHLDKDTLNPNNKLYSPETCIFVDISTNNKSKPNQMFTFIATDPIGNVYEASNQSDFAKEYNLNQSCISACLKGRLGSHYGWKFRYKG